MQTLELVSRLLKRWGMNMGNLPADVQQTLLDCMNGGIQEFYRLAPAVYREATITAVLAAPQTVNIGVSQGSGFFIGYDAPASNYFSTIRIPTDTTTDNLIIPPTGLISPYQGVTSTQPALIFGDTYPLTANIERMIDEPALLGFRHRLVRNDEYWGRGWGIWGGHYSGSGVARRVGVPRTYWVEPNAACVGTGPSFILRVDPLPNALYTLRARALFYPLKLTMGNLQVNTPIPINDAWIESMFIPLILEQMTEDPLWTAKNTDKIEKKAIQARADISDLSPVIEKPNYRCETPPGW